MSIAILLQQILIIFLEIGTGAAVTKLGIMDDRNSKFLSNLVMSVTLPCTLLASASIDGGREAVAGMLKGYVVLEIFYILTIGICLVLSRAMHLTRGQKAVLVGAAVMPNSAFIGIPLISALLGSEAGALYGAAGIMAYNILFFTYVQHLFDPEAKVSIKAFLTPTNITTAIMVIMLVTGLRLPAILESFCKAVGNTTTPLALMIAGGMLARSDLKKLVTNPMVWLITALRCVVFPLGFLAALYFLPLDRTLCMAILILAGRQPDGRAGKAVRHRRGTGQPGRCTFHPVYPDQRAAGAEPGQHAVGNINKSLHSRRTPAAEHLSTGSSPRFGCVREKEERFFLWQMSTISSRK